MTGTSEPTWVYQGLQAVQTISIIDRNIIRQKLAIARQEIDATIRMIDKTDKPLRKEQFEKLLMRWHELLISALNQRKE